MDDLERAMLEMIFEKLGCDPRQLGERIERYMVEHERMQQAGFKLGNR